LGFFSNVKNPITQADTSNFIITLFKDWDIDANQGLLKISEASTYFMPASKFDFFKAELTGASITVSSSNLVSYTDNVATITFTIGSALPNLGIIEIETP
jgi:hypothetical protein